MRLVAERARMVREWRSWILRVAKAIREIWPEAEAYLVGSVARGEAIGSSDVDLLVVLDNPPETPREQAQARVLIEEKAGLPDYNPLDLHFTSRSMRDEWLRRAKHYKKIL